MYLIERSQRFGMDCYTLSDGMNGVSAGILPERGALLCSLTLNGSERMYVNADNLTSSERPRCGMPVLFPLCGRVANDSVSIDGNAYPMTIHGFAHTSAFTVMEAAADETCAKLVLQLHSSDETRSQYPFDFSLTVTFTLKNGELLVSHRILNTGSGNMPCHYGYHPYFLIDSLPGARVTVPGREPVEMPAPTNGESGAFLPAAGKASLVNTVSYTGVFLTFTDSFRALVLWSVPEKGFLCVEPWQAAPNGKTIEGGARLAPGEASEGLLTLRPF